MSVPTVALDCRLLAWPGIGRYCREIASGLVEAAPDLRFLWLCNGDDAASLPQGPRAGALSLRSRPLGLAEQFELPWLLARHRIDLLHAPAAQTLPLLAPRLVVTVHDLTLRHFPEFLPSRLGRLYYRIMNATAVRRARRLVAVSEFTRRDVASVWPQAASRLRVVGNGVAAMFAPVTDAGQLARVRAALQLPQRYLLFVGTWKRHKNLPRLLEAYGRLRPAQRRLLPLVVVAPSDARYPEVPAAARAAGIDGEVLWRSGVADADLPALYTMARCLVLPSLYEGFGLPVAEAMACGTPSIVSTAGALTEVGGDACLAFPPQNVGALAECLRRIAEDDSLHADLAARALRRAPQFDWAEAARRLAGIYREALR